MSFDISGLGIGFGPPGDVAESALSADPATAGSASLGGDAISTSPLAHFGDMVQQIGRSMTQDPAQQDPTAHGAAMGDAIGMLESVIGLMSLYGDGATDTAVQRLESGSTPALENLD